MGQITKVTPDMIQVANNVTSKTVGNTTSGISLTFDSNGVITSASNVTLSVANTQLTGTITATQLAANSVNSTIIAANTISNTNIQTGAIENYSRATGILSGMRNRIINGAMVIDQRNAGASVTIGAGASTYTLDRFWAFADSASKFSIQQNAGSVTPPVGFRNYLGCTSLSAYSLGAGDRFVISQSIEGLNIADLMWGTANAQTVTLSFWVRSSLTGTFGGSLRNDGNTRSYPYTYTISSANTWEYKTVTIAGDTTGTWGASTNTGINVIWSLGTGSTYSGTAGAWAGANLTSATGATSVVGTNGATFYITGVQLEAGSTPTSFEYRSYGTELALCQRYFFSVGGQIYSTASIGGTAYSTNWCFGLVKSPVTMRAMPTFTKTGNWQWNDYNAVSTNTGDLTFTAQNSTLDAFWVASHGTSSGLTALQAYLLSANNSATARLSFSAEL